MKFERNFLKLCEKYFKTFRWKFRVKFAKMWSNYGKIMRKVGRNFGKILKESRSVRSKNFRKIVLQENC